MCLCALVTHGISVYGVVYIFVYIINNIFKLFVNQNDSLCICYRGNLGIAKC